ncbi:hypothetical protein [Nocardiopsis baichengensis]|uniref:hypothetical protein n=1 Tax=Nocardiopsis baichengensis TaxID=280240 RepID=UPI00037C3C28|nr:hypothetical protein [Nocardiopsis baichengensis]
MDQVLLLAGLGFVSLGFILGLSMSVFDKGKRSKFAVVLCMVVFSVALAFLFLSFLVEY